jgi:hypothetical protein
VEPIGFENQPNLSVIYVSVPLVPRRTVYDKQEERELSQRQVHQQLRL